LWGYLQNSARHKGFVNRFWNILRRYFENSATKYSLGNQFYLFLWRYFRNSALNCLFPDYILRLVITFLSSSGAILKIAPRFSLTSITDGRIAVVEIRFLISARSFLPVPAPVAVMGRRLAITVASETDNSVG